MTISAKEEPLQLLMQILCDKCEAEAKIRPQTYSAALDIATKNKIFLTVYEKSLNLCLNMPPKAHLLAKQIVLKKEAQRKAMREMTHAAESVGVEFMVVKTFKPFEYVGDDVDILISDKNNMHVLTKALNELGYFTRKVGTPEITLRKSIMGVPVDLDIHHELAAGHIQYIDIQEVWRSRTKRRIDELEVLTPTPEYEFLIMTAHSLLKESRMTLADFYHYMIESDRLPQGDLPELASRNGLMASLKIFACVANHFLRYFGQCPLSENDDGLTSAIGSRISRSNHNMPYAYPPEALFYAHLDKFRNEITRQGFHAIPDYLKIPSSRGIALLLDYLGWISLKKEPIPWE